MSDALDDLVREFSVALLAKLREAEAKYGYSNDWARDGWGDALRQHIREHVEKGDPRDVAAYCAFAWHHGWTLAIPPQPTSRFTACAEAREAAKGTAARLRDAISRFDAHQPPDGSQMQGET